MTVSQTFQADAVSAQYRFPEGSTYAGPAVKATLTVRYDAEAKSYSVTEGDTTQVFAPTHRVRGDDPRGDLYLRRDGTLIDRLLMTRAGDDGLFTYRYVGAGLWRRSSTTDGVTSHRLRAFTFGMRTADDAVPRTGDASFAIRLHGNQSNGESLLSFDGTGLLHTDFATGALRANGVMTARSSSNDRYYHLSFGSFRIEAMLAGVGNGFSGKLFLGDDYRTAGLLDGNFYGPGLEEVGAAIYGTNSRYPMAGTLIGRRGTTAPASETLTTLLSSISFQRYSNQLNYNANADGTYRSPSLDAGSQSELRYDLATSSFDLGSDVIAGPDQVQADAANYTRFTTYKVNIGRSSSVNPTYRTITTYRPGSDNRELALSYVSFMSDSYVEPFERRWDRWSIHGLETGWQMVPQSGTASYRGMVYGSALGSGDAADRYTLRGETGIEVDFAKLTLAGVMTPTATNMRTGVATALGEYRFATDKVIDRAMMSPIVRADITGPTGTSGRLTGQFFGPQAQELGATFTLTTPGAGTVLTGAGVLVARQP